jgi:hypothetical protein
LKRWSQTLFFFSTFAYYYLNDDLNNEMFILKKNEIKLKKGFDVKLTKHGMAL